MAPLLEGNDDDDDDEAAFGPVPFLPEASRASRPRVGGGSRSARLLESTRFAPAFFKSGRPSGVLPSYDAALEGSAQNALGRHVEPQASPGAVTLTAPWGQLSKLEFVQKEDAGLVLGSSCAAQSL